MSVYSAKGIGLGLAIGASAAFGAAGSASAQQANNCMAPQELADRLLENFEEQQIGLGLVDEQTLLQIYASENGSFSVAQTTAGGQSCLTADGDSWQAVEDVDVSSIPEQELEPKQKMAMFAIQQQTGGTCGDPVKMIQRLSEKYQEEVIAVANAGGDMLLLLDTPDGAVDAEDKPSEDSWTLMSVYQDEQIGASIGCIEAAGSDWSPVTPGKIDHSIEAAYKPAPALAPR